MNTVYHYHAFNGFSKQTIFNIFFYIINVPRTIFCQIAYFFVNKAKKELIMSDVGTYNNMIVQLIFFPYYRTLFYHRIGNYSKLFSWVLSPDSSIIIPFSTPIGKHAWFIHNYGSHINAESIGDNFICYQYVVIGMSTPNIYKRPIICNNVTIGTGAVIIGDITIGDNVIIGANAMVNRSVPSNCIVIGNPAKIVQHNGKKCDDPLV